MAGEELATEREEVGVSRGAADLVEDSHVLSGRRWRLEKRSHHTLRSRFVDIRESRISGARLDIVMGVRYNARVARRKTNWNFSIQASMKVFEFSQAVVEDGFAEKGRSCAYDRQVTPPRYADFAVIKES